MNFDMSKLMQQAQKMQEQIKKNQHECENIEVIGKSGVDLISVVMTGKYDVKSVSIDNSLMSEDKEILEDLIAAAFNSAVKQIEKKSNLSNNINKIAKDVGINFPFK